MSFHRKKPAAAKITKEQRSDEQPSNKSGGPTLIKCGTVNVGQMGGMTGWNETKPFV